jgi:resuscitation-promoting factor RpfB
MTKPELPKSTVGFKPKLSTWVAGGVVLLVLIIGVASGGFGGLLIMGGLVGLGTALYSFVTRRKSWAQIASRRIAAIVAAACLVATFGGGAVYGATHDSVEPTASVTESASASPSSEADAKADSVATPTNEPSPVASPEPTPSAEPTVVPPPAPVVAPAPAPVVAPAPAPKVAPAPAPKVAPAPVAAPAPAPAGCDPNYSGQCVPIASDVDCAGGSGNGPAYITGTVRVVGTDIYGLDRDHDGVGCE